MTTERRHQTRDTPSENIRRYRGDWILEGLVSIQRGQTRWYTPNDKPGGISTPTGGRFDLVNGVWDTQAGERVDMGPKEAILRIHPEEDIKYRGEHVTLNPTYARHLMAHVKLHGLLDTFHEYATSSRRAAIAAYWPSRKQVCWGNTSTRKQRELVLLLSDEVPYQPHTGKPSEAAHAD